MSIGKNIKAMRKLHKITQGELADKLNVTNKAISSWECDRTEPCMGMIEGMCKIFQCTKTELIDGLTIDDIQHDDRHDEIMKYAKLLSELDASKLDNVMQYIDFLSSKGGDPE